MSKSAKVSPFFRKFSGKEKGDSLREKAWMVWGGFVFRFGGGYLLL